MYFLNWWQFNSPYKSTTLHLYHLMVKGTFEHAQSSHGGKLVENWLQHITLHVFTHTWSRSRDGGGNKIRSARNGSNTQFSMSASKPRAPTLLLTSDMADSFKAVLHPPAYVNIPAVTQREYQNRPDSALQPLHAFRCLKYATHQLSLQLVCAAFLYMYLWQGTKLTKE